MRKVFFRRFKFKNEPIVIDEHKFPSKKEASRYIKLKIAEDDGFISDLEVHPRFDLVVNGMKIGTYTADFRYKDNETGEVIVEDVKGYKTREYKRVKKLMKAIYNIDIKEV